MYYPVRTTRTNIGVLGVFFEEKSRLQDNGKQKAECNELEQENGGSQSNKQCHFGEKLRKVNLRDNPKRLRKFFKTSWWTVVRKYSLSAKYHRWRTYGKDNKLLVLPGKFLFTLFFVKYSCFAEAASCSRLGLILSPSLFQFLASQWRTCC